MYPNMRKVILHGHVYIANTNTQHVFTRVSSHYRPATKTFANPSMRLLKSGKTRDAVLAIANSPI